MSEDRYYVAVRTIGEIDFPADLPACQVATLSRRQLRSYH